MEVVIEIIKLDEFLERCEVSGDSVESEIFLDLIEIFNVNINDRFVVISYFMLSSVRDNIY